MPGGGRPHVTLAACERLDVGACERFLASFADTVPAPTVSFASLGVFATDPAVVFLAPVVTADLVVLHDRFHRRFRELAGEPSVYYLPGQWVPHCTLAEKIPRAAVPAAIARCLSVPLPRESQLVEVGLVEFPPIRPRPAFRFTGG